MWPTLAAIAIPTAFVGWYLYCRLTGYDPFRLAPPRS